MPPLWRLLQVTDEGAILTDSVFEHVMAATRYVVLRAYVPWYVACRLCVRSRGEGSTCAFTWVNEWLLFVFVTGARTASV